tara:strand:+ start:1211 stop:1444 length:234 start_codon:yes stop_codon:yes gene_type:complete
MNNQEYTINFMYFAFNFPYKFIEDVWADNPSLSKHFRDKFNSLAERNVSMTIFKWFMELDNGNKTILLNWIEKNYNN